MRAALVSSTRDVLPANLLRFVRGLALGAVFACVSAALAAAPCGALLGEHLEREAVVLLPCLVDMQGTALCFGEPGVTPGAALQQLDAYLQARGVPRPEWLSNESAHATRFAMPSGDVLEIVLASDGPFSTLGSCRVVPQR
jgi:hypothetical protein